MVADERVTEPPPCPLQREGEACIVKRAAISMFANDPFYNGFHEPLLEVERRLHPTESQPQQTITKELRQPGRESLHDDIKLSIS